jgi:two-component system, chemotaxis family, sensor kinase CheA
MDELLGEFLAETEESLDRLDVELVRFEREPNNRDILNTIFRLVHTVKGTCGFLGLDRLARLAHAAEALMGEYRDGAPVTVEGVSVILASLDRIKLILSGLEQEGSEPCGSDADLIGALEALTDDPMSKSFDAERLSLGPVEPLAAPRAGDDEPAPQPPGLSMSDAPSASGEEGDGDSDHDEDEAGDRIAVAARSQSDSVPSNMAQTVRIRVSTLEHLMTTVSELVLTRNQLMDLVRQKPNTVFDAPLHRLSAVTGELQRGVMKARMLPISKAWQKLPRLVRELSLELHKPLDLKMTGGDTELDRQVLELIRDPITHMIRNAADHGIEHPAARKAAGKPETGCIRLSAYSEGGHIVVEIADDGRGLDIEAIKAKCLEQGLASQAELARLSPSEIEQFIFKPGFSTAAEITGISGRGVGLDVVRSNVELIGGSVELKSDASGACVFSLRIPLTLAITAALIVESAGLRFAIPQHNVIEVVRAKQGSEYRIELIKDAPQLRLRGKLVPVFDLGRLLRLPQAAATAEHRLLGDAATIVVMEIGSRVFGVLVDASLRTEEIVVKPKAALLRDLAMFSGNTILGDGSVIMIIDPNALATLAGVSEIHAETDGEANRHMQEAAETVAPLLLVRAGPTAKKAVPLSLVTRLEEIPVAEIESCSEGDVVKYRGGLMPIILVDGATHQTQGVQPVLVFAEGGNHIGLAVDDILDIVDVPAAVEIRGDAPGLIGAALVQGDVVEMLDVSHYICHGLAQRLVAKEGAWDRNFRLLLVDDSPFFRNMLAPLLTATGYEVTLAASAHEALEIKEEGGLFDVIVSDLEMPGMDGIAFAEHVKSDRRWGSIPMIALSSHASPRLLARSRAAGFADYVGKFDRQKLMDALEACCASWGVAA